MNELEKHNNDFQTLLGNSEKLEPMRRRRKSAIPGFFQRIRIQACNLHSVLEGAWKCDCPSAHATKLLLENRVDKNKMGHHEVQDSEDVKFSVFFCLKPQSRDAWCATDIKMAAPNKVPGRRLSQATDSGSQQDIETLSQVRSSIGNVSVCGTSTKISMTSDAKSRTVSFLSSGLESLPSSMLSDGSEILDLCSALEQRPKLQQSLGFLRDGLDRYYAIDLATSSKLSPSDISTVLTLESLINGSNATFQKSSASFPRRTRLALAVILANSLLQLHTGPWLPESWGKRDIYFFQSRDGTIHIKHPFLLHHFKSMNDATRSEPDLSKLNFGRPPSRAGNPSLFSLGVVILELWFNQTLESQPFQRDYLGPDGKKSEYTDFNTTQKWQEMTMEEAGPDLYNPTRRCVYCAFGAASQDLEDDELRKAVFAEVVEPLERLLGRFEDVLKD